MITCSQSCSQTVPGRQVSKTCETNPVPDVPGCPAIFLSETRLPWISTHNQEQKEQWEHAFESMAYMITGLGTVRGTRLRAWNWHAFQGDRICAAVILFTEYSFYGILKYNVGSRVH